MKKKLFVVTMLFCMALRSESQEIKNKLEITYKAFYAAMIAKDGEQLKNTLGSAAYMTVKNGMLSAGMKFPDEFFASAGELPDINKLTYKQVFTNGSTANCIYYNKDKDGDFTIYTLMFVQEGNVWKFNLSGEYGSEDINKAAKSGDFSFLSDKKFQPDGIMPTIPAAIVPGDFVAMIDIMSYEYEVGTTVNGNIQDKANGGSRSGLLIGGLKKGKNKIVITSKQLKSGGKPSKIKVKVRAQINGQLKEVFSLEEGDPLPVITKEFVVQ